MFFTIYHGGESYERVCPAACEAFWAIRPQNALMVLSGTFYSAQICANIEFMNDFMKLNPKIR